jgi:hypothetical protein
VRRRVFESPEQLHSGAERDDAATRPTGGAIELVVGWTTGGGGTGAFDGDFGGEGTTTGTFIGTFCEAGCTTGGGGTGSFDGSFGGFETTGN